MPTIGGPRDIANQIKADAVSSGMDAQKLRDIGMKLLNLQMDVSGFLPSLEGQLDDLAGGILVAAEELAQNTQPEPEPDPGVTA
jgi:hypothetical protein